MRQAHAVDQSVESRRGFRADTLRASGSLGTTSVSFELDQMTGGPAVALHAGSLIWPVASVRHRPRLHDHLVEKDP